MNKLINIGQYKATGNCVYFVMDILIKILLNVEVFIKITNLNQILKRN